MNLINDFDMERISQAIEDIGSLCIADIFSPGKLWYAPVKMDWKTAPEFDLFGPMDRWGGYDEYGWFRCIFTIPAEADGKELWVEISQDKREWYAQNPQFLLYCNEKPVQGLDLYHYNWILMHGQVWSQEAAPGVIKKTGRVYLQYVFSLWRKISSLFIMI